MKKLNLGCGNRIIPGCINVDKESYYNPDVVWDLEVTLWPFETSSIDEIYMSHVLEHLGADTRVFLNIMKELYRILKNNGKIFISVPHPRSDDFLNDPTHVRPVTPTMMSLFSKKANREALDHNGANTPLALYLDVDLEIEAVSFTMDPAWKVKYDAGIFSDADMEEAVRAYNNVVSEIQMRIRAVK